MSVYMCNLLRGKIPDHAKRNIAADITKVHCELTDTAPDLVHVFFFEDVPRTALSGKSIFMFGNICGSRLSFSKEDLIEQIGRIIHRHSDVPMRELFVDTTDIPADWVLEGGACAA